MDNVQLIVSSCLCYRCHKLYTYYPSVYLYHKIILVVCVRERILAHMCMRAKANGEMPGGIAVQTQSAEKSNREDCRLSPTPPFISPQIPSLFSELAVFIHFFPVLFKVSLLGPRSLLPAALRHSSIPRSFTSLGESAREREQHQTAAIFLEWKKRERENEKATERVNTSFSRADSNRRNQSERNVRIKTQKIRCWV